MKKTFCERLRFVRGDRTLKEASALIKTKFQNLQRWESGTCEPDIDTLHKICETFGVSLDWLVGLDAAVEPPAMISERKLYDSPGEALKTMTEMLASQQRVIEQMTQMLSGGTGRAAAPARSGGRGATKTA